MITVTHIVSLGLACRITYNLRRYYGYTESFPFDWWVTSTAGVISALKSDADPYSDGNLSEVTTNGVQLIRSAAGIDFVHEFPKAIFPEWRDHLEKPRGRFFHARDRLFGLNVASSSILFVRHGRTTLEEAQCLISAVSSAFTLCTVNVLLVNTGVIIPDDRVHSVEFADTERHWTGNAAEWDFGLGKAPFALAK